MRDYRLSSFPCPAPYFNTFRFILMTFFPLKEPNSDDNPSKKTGKISSIAEKRCNPYFIRLTAFFSRLNLMGLHSKSLQDPWCIYLSTYSTPLKNEIRKVFSPDCLHNNSEVPPYQTDCGVKETHLLCLMLMCSFLCSLGNVLFVRTFSCRNFSNSGSLTGQIPGNGYKIFLKF